MTLSDGDRARLGMLGAGLCLAYLLYGCSTSTPAPVSVCPAPVPYTRAEMRDAAQALAALPQGSILARMLQDYGRERAELRACRAAHVSYEVRAP